MMPLATDEEYRAIIGTDPPAGLLDAVSAQIRKYCGWHIAPARVDTLTVDGSGGHYLLLPTAHLVDVVAISNGGAALDPLDVEWSEAGLVRRACRWTDKLRGIVITIQHGWDPADITDIAMQAVLIAARVATVPRGETLTTLGAVSAQYGATGIALTPTEQFTLGAYCVAGR